MSEFLSRLNNANVSELVDKKDIVEDISKSAIQNGYEVIEINDTKPWGAYFRLDNSNADRFVEEFFPSISISEARLGNNNAEISPKILLVSPNQRLSWQYHNRRSELWSFVTDGVYIQSLTNQQGELSNVKSGDLVQFAALERHRLIGRVAAYTIVAEIWQHTDSDNLSDEDDIVRLEDDYSR